MNNVCETQESPEVLLGAAGTAGWTCPELGWWHLGTESLASAGLPGTPIFV